MIQQPSVQRLRLAGDVDLELFEQGSGPRALLALHGMLELPGWTDYHRLLADRFRVIAPSHPGFGGSTRPAWLDSVDDLALCYLELIDQLRLDRPIVLGHSFGGWIAAEMAIRCPRSLGGLVLVDAVGIRPSADPFGPPGGSIADWLVLEPEDLRARAWHDPATGARLKLPGEDATTDEELTAILTNRQAATVYGWRPFFYNPRLPHWLHRITAPTLVVWGRHDGVVPLSVGQAYAQAIPGARLEVLDGAAHLPHLELPDAFARLVTSTFAEA
jgi:pimeloyl-ACP methyl ester carboxylesterase